MRSRSGEVLRSVAEIAGVVFIGWLMVNALVGVARIVWNVYHFFAGGL